MSLGRYVDFPFRGHYEVAYLYAASRRDLTSCLLAALRELKTRNVEANLSIAGVLGEVRGSRTIRVEVAEGNRFRSYGPKVQTELGETELAVTETSLDFALTFRYSYLKDAKRIFLYSDRFLVRFLIRDGRFQLQVFHRRGTGRTSPEEVAALVEAHLVQIMRSQSLEPRVEILQDQM